MHLLQFHRFRDTFSSKHRNNHLWAWTQQLELKIAQGLYTVYGQDAQAESFYERIVHG